MGLLHAKREGWIRLEWVVVRNYVINVIHMAHIVSITDSISAKKATGDWIVQFVVRFTVNCPNGVSIGNACFSVLRLVISTLGWLPHRCIGTILRCRFLSRKITETVVSLSFENKDESNKHSNRLFS